MPGKAQEPQEVEKDESIVEDPQPKAEPKTLDVNQYPEEIRHVMADLLEQKQKANREAGTSRKKLEALIADQENKTKEAERSKLEETERLKLEKREAEERASRAEERVNHTLKEAAIVSVASRLNFHNPQKAVHFVDLSHLDITDGQVSELQVMELLTKLAQDEPYLINKEKPAPSLAPTIGPTSPTPLKQPGQPKTPEQNFKEEVAGKRAKGDFRGILSSYRKRLVEQSSKTADMTPIK